MESRSRAHDYSVDYDLGRVSFNRPDTLFPRPRQVTVQYEENRFSRRRLRRSSEQPRNFDVARTDQLHRNLAKPADKLHAPSAWVRARGFARRGSERFVQLRSGAAHQNGVHVPFGETTAPSRIGFPPSLPAVVRTRARRSRRTSSRSRARADSRSLSPTNNGITAVSPLWGRASRRDLALASSTSTARPRLRGRATEWMRKGMRSDTASLTSIRSLPLPARVYRPEQCFG